jgi:hypothetical protein
VSVGRLSADATPYPLSRAALIPKTAEMARTRTTSRASPTIAGYDAPAGWDRFDTTMTGRWLSCSTPIATLPRTISRTAESPRDPTTTTAAPWSSAAATTALAVARA